MHSMIIMNNLLIMSKINAFIKRNKYKGIDHVTRMCGHGFRKKNAYLYPIKMKECMEYLYIR